MQGLLHVGTLSQTQAGTPSPAPRAGMPPQAKGHGLHKSIAVHSLTVSARNGQCPFLRRKTCACKAQRNFTVCLPRERLTQNTFSSKVFGGAGPFFKKVLRPSPAPRPLVRPRVPPFFSLKCLNTVCVCAKIRSRGDFSAPYLKNGGKLSWNVKL